MPHTNGNFVAYCLQIMVYSFHLFYLMLEYFPTIMKTESSTHSHSRHSFRFQEYVRKFGDGYLESFVTRNIRFTFQKTLKNKIVC